MRMIEMRTAVNATQETFASVLAAATPGSALSEDEEFAADIAAFGGGAA